MERGLKFDTVKVIAKYVAKITGKSLAFIYEWVIFFRYEKEKSNK